MIIVTEKDRLLRSARLLDGKVDAFYTEGLSVPASILGNIYQGIVRRVDKNLQAFFVDIGIKSHVLIKMSSKALIVEGMSCIVEITRDATFSAGARKGPRGKLLDAGSTHIHAPHRLTSMDGLQSFIGEETDIIVNTPTLVLRLRMFGIPPRNITFIPNTDLFCDYNVEDTWLSTTTRIVPLENGGELVFDKTEALIVIDVNSSSLNSATRVKPQHINAVAVKEIALQIRWRHTCGIILIDFIGDYRDAVKQKLHNQMLEACRQDRAVTVHGVTRLGLLEITRSQKSDHLPGYTMHAVSCGGL